MDAVQVEYSPWTVDLESNGLLAACRELGVTIVAYSPLGRGFLAGRFKSIEDMDEDDWRRTNPRFSSENFKKNLTLVDRIKLIADKKGCTAGQLCLAWLAAQGDDILTIPGTTSTGNLQSNFASNQIEVSKEEEAQIRDIIDSIKVQGDRYPEGMMKMVNI